MCGETTKAELSAIPYSFAHQKTEPSTFNVPSYPFTITIPDFWMAALVNDEVVMICPFCPNKESNE